MGFETGLPSWQAAWGLTFSAQHICIFFFSIRNQLKIRFRCASYQFAETLMMNQVIK